MTPAAPAAGGRDPSVMGFVGVSTADSSIMRVFPAWAEELGLPTRTLQGHDLPLDAPPSVYRDIIGVIRDDPRYRGALVTTHKMAVFRHARDLFDDLDELALLFGEISSVARRGDRLTGAAKDPVTVRLALDEFVPADHFATSGGAALVLGSGGAGCALTYALGRRSDVPAAIICTALEAGPLDHQRELHARAGIYPDRLRYVVTSSTDDVDALLSGLPPGSLVVNATGMGKDRPGSPVGAAPRFPRGGLVWDFNYRGSLEFLAQARGQRAERRLHVEDGWRYFVHGWASVIADVFEVPMPPAQVARLAAVAEQVRR